MTFSSLFTTSHDGRSTRRGRLRGLLTAAVAAPLFAVPVASAAASTGAASTGAASTGAASTGAASTGAASTGAAEAPWEVSQVPQAPHAANPTNPLAGRRWGVYLGPQDQVYEPYKAATGATKELIGKIALRPRTKWYGGWVADGDIKKRVSDYIRISQAGDPEALVQLAVFRMEPWEHEACDRAPTAGEKASYRTWVTNLAAGIGSTPTLVVMQPDGPFLWCAPDIKATAGLLRFATKKLSALPRTSVYIDAGAADWCENGRGNDPERCASLLERTGVQFARGFALDSTHYTGPSDNIRHGTAIARILERDGYGTKHFIVDTAKSGRPMHWADVIPAERGGLKDNARTCTSSTMRQCVTLGIPPTARPAETGYGLAKATRKLAAEYVDGFVWFGRPWLFNQADPFVLQRAVDMGLTTPWPGPRHGTPPKG
jgi:hypothetical protein